MKIPQPLPQFETVPTLFIVAGQFEVKFLVAHKGEIDEKEPIEMSMREEGQEKQAYQHGNPAPHLMGAVSHYGAYHRDLIDKVHRAVTLRVADLTSAEKIENIFVFAPEHALKGIVESLKDENQAQIKGKFEGEYTKLSPVKIIELLEEKTSIDSFEAKSKEEKTILEKPTTH